MINFKGVYPPIITIFDKNGNFDIEANKKQADFLINNGVDGLVYLGTSGEFSSLNLQQKKEIMDIMYPYVQGRVRVVAGVGECNLADTLDMIRYAEKMAVDGIIVVNPYYNVYSDAMVIAYFDKVAKSTLLPLIIYNIPALTGYKFSVEVVKAIVKNNSNVVGIKESLNDLEHLKGILEVKEISPNFVVYVAYENLAFEGLMAGAEGFINATANFAPEFAVKAYQAFQDADFDACKVYAQKMTDAMEMYELSTPLYLACKQAAYNRVLGEDMGEILPALSLDDKAKEGVRRVLSKLGL